MTETVSSILMFLGLACLSAAAAVFVGLLAFHTGLPFGRNRNAPKGFRFAEERKITRVNDPSAAHSGTRRTGIAARAKAAPAYMPLQIRVRFRREEWALKPSERLLHRANWN